VGHPAEVTDPAYSSRIFYERLMEVPGWDSMPVTKAAQTVQRSAFPDAYAKWEGLAASLVENIGDVANPTGCAPGTTGALPPGVAGAAIGFALGELGKPYVWGATGPDSWDCSSLLQASYRAAGVTIPRVSRDQYNSGGHLPVRDMQPGDFLFYAHDTSDPTTIYHVMMYLGDGKMVEAPNRNFPVRVQPVSWSSPISSRSPPGRGPRRTPPERGRGAIMGGMRSPLSDYLDSAAPGACPDHLVVPRSLAQSMPLRWQQVFVGLLADLHDAYGDLDWPDYRVVPSRWPSGSPTSTRSSSPHVGYVADLGPDGELEYRDARRARRRPGVAARPGGGARHRAAGIGGAGAAGDRRPPLTAPRVAAPASPLRCSRRSARPGAQGRRRDAPQRESSIFTAR
jgi:hypothetical protein